MRRPIAALALAALALGAADRVVARGDGGPALFAQRGRGGGRRGAARLAVEARSLVRGRLAAVDPTTGRAAVDVDGTTLAADFAPSVVAGMKPGDIVFVTIDVISTRLAAIAASVASVDATKGTLTIATPQGPLTLTSLAEALGAMKPGDQVLLKLDLLDIGPPFTPPAP